MQRPLLFTQVRVLALSFYFRLDESHRFCQSSSSLVTHPEGSYHYTRFPKSSFGGGGGFINTAHQTVKGGIRNENSPPAAVAPMAPAFIEGKRQSGQAPPPPPRVPRSGPAAHTLRSRFSGWTQSVVILKFT